MSLVLEEVFVKEKAVCEASVEQFVPESRSCLLKGVAKLEKPLNTLALRGFYVNVPRDVLASLRMTA